MLVVTIHNNYTFDIIAKSSSEIIFCPSSFSIWVQFFISNGIACCAVPVFFMFSSYLQFKKNDKYIVLLKKRTRSLVVPYFLWTILLLSLFAFAKFAMQKFKPTVLDNPDRLFPFETPIEWLWAFIGDYSEYGTYASPYIGHFWFIRDLFILVLLSPLLKKSMKRFPVETLLFSAFCYFSGIRPVVVNVSALFFYVLGFFWAEGNIDVFNVADRCSWWALFVFFSLFVFLKKEFYSNLPSVNAAVVFFASLILLKISALICKKEKFYALTKYLAGYSFFFFAIQRRPLEGWVQKIWREILPMKNWAFCLLEYFGASIMIIIIGTGIGILLKCICPKLFSLLSGGR